jgi:hypothetical protein
MICLGKFPANPGEESQLVVSRERVVSGGGK